MLQQLFFGVSIEQFNASEHEKFQCDIGISFKYNFSVANQPSKFEALNRASCQALNSLCDIENKFIRERRCDVFLPDFASDIQK